MDHNSLGLHRRSLSVGEEDAGAVLIAPGYFHRHCVMTTFEEVGEE
jgi:hypothetical protein